MRIDDRFEKPPILIGGCGRSGTSLLLSIISARPSIFAIPNETGAFCPTAYSENIDRSASLETNRIRDILRSADIKPGATRWCEKTPKNVLFFESILKTLGSDVRILNIVRDGRDVLTSRHPQRFTSSWVGIDRWVRDVSAGMPFDTHPQVFVIRYEDLVLKFNETLEKICGFLDEPLDQNLLDWHRHTRVRTHGAWSDNVAEIHGQSIGRWRLPQYKKVVAKMMSDGDAIGLLKNYGYVNSDQKGWGTWKPSSAVRRLKRRVPEARRTAVKRFLGLTDSGWKRSGG
ncbi:MAG: sulfotransferase [Pyrinomonadaceae bacterium]|nr:sulfotransferase [Pyrinomonadaceae bacterium]